MKPLMSQPIIPASGIIGCAGCRLHGPSYSPAVYEASDLVVEENKTWLDEFFLCCCMHLMLLETSCVTVLQNDSRVHGVLHLKILCNSSLALMNTKIMWQQDHWIMTKNNMYFLFTCLLNSL